MKHKHRLAGYGIFLGLLVVTLLVIYFLPDWEMLSSPSLVREYIINAGANGHFIFAILLILSVPLPIPSTPLVVSGGYLYGLWAGTLLAIIANTIGAVISFYMVRLFGRPLLETVVDKHHIEHFNHILHRKGIPAVFISYAIPLFPSDAVSMILGMSRMKLPLFLLLVIVGHIPRYLILNSLGKDIYAGFTTLSVLVITGTVLLALVVLFREKIKKLIFKELRMLETSVLP